MYQSFTIGIPGDPCLAGWQTPAPAHSESGALRHHQT